MIPIKLTLKNFMSYGAEPTTLPLEGLHVACLSGDNGNGKSALLDAMTWALWGKTRASATKSISEDDLIRLGADEVEVRFEFELNGQRYRVVRKRKRGKTGAQWELTQSDGSGHYLPVGGGSMRETGRQITQLLSMEYETFLNSAYLQQGHADEFTRQTPDNRKRILAEILGLDRYDVLESKARELSRERDQQVKELEGEIRLLDGQIADRANYQAQMEAACQQLQDVETKFSAQEEIAVQLRDRRSKLDELAARLSEQDAQLARQQATIASRKEERRKQATRLEEIRRVLEQKEAILGDYTALQNAQRRREQLEPEIEAFNKANSELKTVIGAIDIEETQLRAELRVQEQELKAVEARRQEHTRLATQSKSLAAALKSESEVTVQAEAAQVALQTAQENFATLRAQHDSLKTEIAEIDEVLELLARPHAQCPVCESDLSGKKHETVVARQQQRRTERCQQQEALKRQGAAAKQARDAAQEQAQVGERKRNELMTQRSQYEQIQERIEALIRQGIEADRTREQVEALKTQLEQGRFAAPKRAQRKRLEAEIERLGLARAEYETVRETIRRLESTHKRYQELRHAEGNWEQEVAAQAQLEAAIATLEQENKTDSEKVEELRKRLAQYESVKQQAAVAEAEVHRLRGEITGLQVAIKRCEDAIANCDRALLDKQARTQAHKKAAEERRIYQDLVAAFGKRGVQALIIENVLPELEEETNMLLARMTDNTMQVNFETTRAARSTGSEIETLDIKITDDAGTRPYELFSGGEAFRINFAVRIALSNLLARRSGAKLQTLILDEGFGTQDGKGREKLVEVIDTIKGDFEKILVITHVEELKDAFSQRIEVTKDAQGSRIHVL